jgi:hypothetical protein
MATSQHSTIGLPDIAAFAFLALPFIFSLATSLCGGEAGQ